MKRQLRLLVERVSGLRIFNHLPVGLDEFEDVKGAFPEHDFSCLLDVGANVGQTARQMRRHFPHAEIHSLEPIASTFLKLRHNVRRLGIRTHQVALGARDETITVHPLPGVAESVMNSLAVENRTTVEGAVKAEPVEVRTLQTFCVDSGITRIDFLKIDTEGFDLEVLKGAGPWIDDQKIPLVIAEVSMNPTNVFHVSFDAVKQYMERRGYYLFGLYDQNHEWKLRKPILRRANSLFVSAEMAR